MQPFADILPDEHDPLILVDALIFVAELVEFVLEGTIRIEQVASGPGPERFELAF
jgi:hypothetical protein